MGCSCLSKTESNQSGKSREVNRGGVQLGGGNDNPSQLNRAEMAQMRAAALEKKRKED